LTAKQAPRRPGTAPALGLRADSDVPPFNCRPTSKGELTMSLHSWLQNLRSALAPGQRQRHHGRRGLHRAATHRPSLEVLEDRSVPALYAVTDLGSLAGNYSDAADLNQAGQVVGYATTADGFNYAFLWDNGTMIELGTLGGSYSYAYSINDLGQVVGTAALPGDVSSHAFLVTPHEGTWFQDSDLDG